MTAEAIYVEILIKADLERVWNLTQDARAHTRWDARFSRIVPEHTHADGSYRFRYETRMPLHTIRGTGTSLGERVRSDGTRTSALKFTTSDRLSPIGDGRGYWRYIDTDEGVRFITGYDYSPGWGAFLDGLALRRLIGWLTAWSFDRLRIWAETGVEPEQWSLVSVLAFWRPQRPRAARTRRVPHRGRPMDAAPESLSGLVAP